MTLHQAILQFEEGGPAATGEWHHGSRRTLRKWVIDRKVITEPGDPL